MADEKDQPPVLSVEQQMMAEFEPLKKELGGKLKQVSESFKNTTKLMEITHQLYHVRQELVDYKRDLAQMMGTLNKQYKRMQHERMMQYKENKIALLPANATEKKVIEQKYFSEVVRIIDQFDTQFSWCKDSIETCDQISNGYSYYIKLATMLGNSGNRG